MLYRNNVSLLIAGNEYHKRLMLINNTKIYLPRVKGKQKQPQKIKTNAHVPSTLMNFRFQRGFFVIRKGPSVYVSSEKAGFVKQRKSRSDLILL